MSNKNTFSKDDILQKVTTVLEDMIADWDSDFTGEIQRDTKLVGDLGFESIDIVQFIVAIEEIFQRRGLPWEEVLMIDGRYVDEIKVGDTVNLLHSNLNS